MRDVWWWLVASHVVLETSIHASLCSSSRRSSCPLPDAEHGPSSWRPGMHCLCLRLSSRPGRTSRGRVSRWCRLSSSSPRMGQPPPRKCVVPQPFCREFLSSTTVLACSIPVEPSNSIPTMSPAAHTPARFVSRSPLTCVVVLVIRHVLLED